MNYKVFLTVIAIAFLGLSCTKKFKEYNTNPNAVPVDQLNYDNVFLGGFLKQMEESVFPVGGVSTYAANDYQLIENLCGDIFGGYHGMTHNWSTAGDNTTYNFTAVDWKAAAFNKFYTGIIKNYDTIGKYAANNPDIIAVSKIIKVQAAHRTVDMYGPIPYFNTKTVLGVSGSAYDPADSIYYSFFEDLDSAILVLKNYISIKPLQYFDAVYAGNYNQWIKFANSLKLRLAMRIRFVDPVNAKRYAEAAISDDGGVISNNEDNAQMRGVGVSYINPLKTLSEAYQEARMSANMQSFLLGYADPRVSKFFNASTYSGDGPNVYRGIRSGSTITSDNAVKYQSFSTLKTDFDVIWMPAAEVYFLRAEGALLGWNMGGTAQSLYETGIKKSFEQWGAGTADTYIADAASKPANYADPVNSANNVSGTGSVDTTTIKWNESYSANAKLQKIITQKWIAMYPNGQEAWSELRRTGFPSIFTVRQNNSGGTVNTVSRVRRLPYPAGEYQQNPINLARGVQLLISQSNTTNVSKGDNGGTNLWWDKR
ncbi:MAG: SusD/RagB family nutrient-binding outer membrane lipoprotein [Niabella sp.]